MDFFEEWVRFTDLKKPCGICGKPDGCCISRDGSKILCSRIESTLKIGEPFAGGYIHAASGEYQNLRMPKKKKIKAPINWTTLCSFYQEKISYQQIEQLAKEWNVNCKNLIFLDIGWDGKAYTFPVYNLKEIIGIQRRFPNGEKSMVKGSSLGLFIPNIEVWPLHFQSLFITEGVSDLAVLLSLELCGIAKPSAKACNDLVIKFLKENNRFEEIIIVSDNDEAGIKGTQALVKELTKDYFKPMTVICPPTGIKDLREWVSKKGKNEIITYLNSL